MASHNGNEIVSYQVDAFHQDLQEPFEIFSSLSMVGIPADGTIIAYSENLSGFENEAAWRLISDGKVYLFPLEIDAGLIAQDAEYDLCIWNAGSDLVSLIAVVYSSPDGITLDITPPVSIYPESEYHYPLTILKNGPPVQSTTILFIFSNGTEHILTVEGRRIEVFPYEVDVSTRVTVQMEFFTVISQSDKFVEQRRSLFAKPKLSMDASFWFDPPIKMQNFMFKLRALSDKILAVPFYPEQHYLIADPNGLSYLLLDVIYGWYLHNMAQYIVLFDVEDALYFELCKIESIVDETNRINLEQIVSKSFDITRTIIAPALLCFAPEIKNEHITRFIAKHSVSFEEYKI